MVVGLRVLPAWCVLPVYSNNIIEVYASAPRHQSFRCSSPRPRSGPACPRQCGQLCASVCMCCALCIVFVLMCTMEVAVIVGGVAVMIYVCVCIAGQPPTSCIQPARLAGVEAALHVVGHGHPLRVRMYCVCDLYASAHGGGCSGLWSHGAANVVCTVFFVCSKQQGVCIH